MTESCDPTHSGHVDGAYGVDIENCGPPGKRLVPELENGVAIGFKTFLQTPDAESLFVKFLAENQLQFLDVIVVDVGVWGWRGNRLAGNTITMMSKEDEIKYYVSWLRQAFKDSTIVFVDENSASGAGGPIFEKQVSDYLHLFVSNDSNSILLPKSVVQNTKVANTPCLHGCAGPVIVAVANLLLDWLSSR